MRYINDKFDITPSYDISKDTIGIVLGTEEELETTALAVFIPKFLLGMIDTVKEGMKDNDLNINIKLLNKKEKSFIGKSVKETNYTILRPLSPGNMGIPKFSKGEKVIVHMFDSDIKTLTFYPFSFDDSANRLEGDEFKIMTPAKGQDGAESEPNTKANNYSIAMDTREDKQLITISTTKKNNEKHAYSMVFDGKNGTWSVTDGSGRSIVMNSEKDTLLFFTEEGACIEAKKDTIKLVAKNVEINAENSFKVTTKNYSLETDDYKEKSSTAKVEHNQFEQTSSKGTYKIDTEAHKGMRFTFNESVGVQMDGSMFAINTLLAAAQFTYGGAPNIDVEIPCPPNTSKTSSGNMEITQGNINVGAGNISVGPGMPLVKFQELSTLLVAMAGMVDTALGANGIPPACLAAVQGSIGGAATTMIKGG